VLPVLTPDGVPIEHRKYRLVAFHVHVAVLVVIPGPAREARTLPAAARAEATAGPIGCPLDFTNRNVTTTESVNLSGAPVGGYY
jgi:hypothetical protein